MSGRHILHVDANSFYSSVEMQENPTLRGKRIAVCGSKEDRHGIVLTASYPAKRMGVKTGMAIWEAQRCCRDLIIVPPHYREYMRYSGYMREILQDYTDQVEAFGLDESWADVSGSVGLFGSAMTIAQEISERVKRELGITVSIGVSDNKVTAKLGSDYKKPDAITRIEADNYKEIVYPLPVQDLLYVGHATQRKLNYYGIRTIGQLAQTNPEVLHGWFGKVGYSLSAFARGLDASPVARQDHVAAD
ncbi:MAG: DNA polymerase thumb domain-containing protein, partial [Blautia massiliensis (ex Durand et al. 2017)]